MANPNILTMRELTGKTALQEVGTSPLAIVTNSSSSNSLVKVLFLSIANVGISAVNATVAVKRGGQTLSLTNNVSIPSSSTLVLLSKETALYLEEGDELHCSGSASNSLHAVCSYEVII